MYVRVEVTPHAKKERVEKTGESRYSVWVREKAERNMANERVVELMAELFGVAPGRVRIISGHRSPRKMLSIDTDEPNATI